MLTRLQLVAVHEAGHAVAMLAAGVPVLCVAVQRSLAGDGICAADPAVARYRSGVERAMVIVAGDVAMEMCQAGWRAPQARAGGWYFDQLFSGPSDRARESYDAKCAVSGTVRVPTDAEHLDHTAVPAHLATAHARAVLCMHWNAVVAIADRLIEGGEIEGAEVHAIGVSHGVRQMRAAEASPPARASSGDHTEVQDLSMTRAQRKLETEMGVGWYVARRIARRLRREDGIIPRDALEMAVRSYGGMRGLW